MRVWDLENSQKDFQEMILNTSIKFVDTLQNFA
jgi:hypothetical protein